MGDHRTFRLLLWAFVGTVAFVVGSWGVGDPPESPIKDDERVVFFDVAAHYDREEEHWVAPIHGWIFEPVDSIVRREAIEQALAAGLGHPIPDESKERFGRLVNGFLVDNERGKRIPVKVGEVEKRLGRSLENGHFHGTLEIEGEPSATGTTSVATTAKDGRAFTGTIHRVPPEGLSVISDIDDTVKVSEVGDLEKMLTHTFLEEFQPAPGMPELFRSWRDAGATFHYVSSSPWHLYEPLVEFMDRVALPRTTLSLKMVRLKDSTIVDLFRPGTETKPRAIRPILERFPGRKFVLVGDSGEHDPEIYAAIQKEFPEQVVAICLRNVTDATRDDARFSKVFEAVDSDAWFLFEDPKELPSFRRLTRADR